MPAADGDLGGVENNAVLHVLATDFDNICVISGIFGHELGDDLEWQLGVDVKGRPRSVERVVAETPGREIATFLVTKFFAVDPRACLLFLVRARMGSKRL